MLRLLNVKNPRILAVAFLGFSSGLPLALTSSTLQAWFTQAGIPLMTIGALTLVGLPYLFKFLWSPLMDGFVPPFWGRRRGWIAITQLLLCVGLFILSGLEPTAQAGAMGALAVMIAFFSASQDIAIDAYRTDIFSPDERATGIAWFIFAARIAGLISGALALVLADHLGWKFTYRLMSLVLAWFVVVTFFAPEIPGNIRPPKNLMASVIEPFRDLFRRESILLILLFIVLYKLGEALALSLMSTFLLRYLDFSLTEVGFASKIIGLVANVLGALAGAAYLSRAGLYRSLLHFGIASACANLLFLVLATVGKNYELMATTLFIENFCSGMSATALVVFLTSLCHQQYSATQFACLSALSAVGRVFLGPVAGVMVEHLGWASFYGWTFFVCFPGIIVLTLLRRKVTFNAEAIA